MNRYILSDPPRAIGIIHITDKNGERNFLQTTAQNHLKSFKYN